MLSILLHIFFIMGFKIYTTAKDGCNTPAAFQTEDRAREYETLYLIFLILLCPKYTLMEDCLQNQV